MSNKQEQRSGDNSTNIQAAEIIVHQGLSYSDVREVALDVFRANFYELAGKARDIAALRAEEITEDFLRKLQAENPGGFSKAEDPDFQYALFTVQREYARSGDQDLGSLLVDLLVDRSKQEQRDILQIVLSESLGTAPKLTTDQLAALAVIFLLRYTQNSSVGNDQSFGEYLDKHLLPFIDKLSKKDSCYQHLQFSGCGSVDLGEVDLSKALANIYQGLFFNGFDAVEVAQREISVGFDPRFFVECLNDPSKIQVRAINKESLAEQIRASSISAEDGDKITGLFELGKMSFGEVRQKCVSIRSYMDKLFDVWMSSSMKSFNLTSVGIAIGHANTKRLVGEFSDLSIWIN